MEGKVKRFCQMTSDPEVSAICLNRIGLIIEIPG